VQRGGRELSLKKKGRTLRGKTESWKRPKKSRDDLITASAINFGGGWLGGPLRVHFRIKAGG